MAITASTVNAKMDLVVTAIEAADWASAFTYAMAGQAALIALPDSELKNDTLEWNREAIDNLLTNIRREKDKVARGPNGFGMIQQTLVNRVDPTT